MTESNSTQESKSADIRAEFDEILMRHISGLIDTRQDIAGLPFNLATIACLLLVVERENEINAFPESPPERYNRETFFSDIEDIGIDLDEGVLVAIQNLEQYGFVVINSKNQYTARPSASLLILLLDAVFPQMPGMNLVAYVSQSIEEVLSGRKEKSQALLQFDQTLSNQGVQLSSLPQDKFKDSVSNTSETLQKPDPAVLFERKEAYLQKLKAMRAKRLQSGGDPTIVGTLSGMENVTITELFPKQTEAPPSENDADDISIEETSNVPDGVSDGGLESKIESQSSLENPTVPEPSEPPVSLDETSAEVDTPKPIQEPEPAQVSDTVEPPVSEEIEMGPDKSLSKEELIEQKIRAFEEELAMPCPICEIGKVLNDTTEKGKTYYHCSNEDCGLISWGKPFHMECPMCKSPFLIEVPDPEGNITLKCPRATCMYRKKDHPGNLAEKMNGSGKKKVAVVRKRRKKGGRRVVRRKS